MNHGGDAAEAELHRIAEPRFTSRTERTEIVGILNNGNLEVFIDDASSNQPLDFDTVEIDSSGQSVSARRVNAGHYRLPANWLTPGKEHNLILTLTGPEQQDLVAASLHIPDAEAVSKTRSEWPLPRILTSVAIALLLVFTLWLVRIGLPAQAYLRVSFDLVVIVALLAGVTALLGINPLKAGFETSVTFETADSPLQQRIRRLSDGSLHVPKPAQRRLGILTSLPRDDRQQRSFTLPGRILPDPSASATVVAAIDGRLEPPENGFPRPGETVKEDQILAYLTPTLTPLERADRKAELAFIERDIYLTRKQIDRIKSQNVVKQDNSILLDVRNAELKGLLNKKKAIESLFKSRQKIRAPIAGVMSDTRITTGQNVGKGEEIFEIIDPRHLWVEAINYDATIPSEIGAARAIYDESRSLPLTYIGTGSRAKGLGQPLLFSLDNPGHLTAGQLVTVSVASGRAVQGISLDTDALSIDANGNSVIWLHTSPERFTPMTVDKTHSGSLDRTFITGERVASQPVVTMGSDLLSAVP